MAEASSFSAQGVVMSIATKAGGSESPTVPFESYAGEDLTRLRIAATTMGDLLLTAADRDPDKLALVFPERGYTYAELAACALRRARSLQALGVKPLIQP